MIKVYARLGDVHPDIIVGDIGVCIRTVNTGMAQLLLNGLDAVGFAQHIHRVAVPQNVV